MQLCLNLQVWALRSMQMSKPMPKSSVCFCALTLLVGGCGGDWIKNLTSKAVAGGVKTRKGVMAGIADGANEGRKEGESLDGALLVDSFDAFAENGTLTIRRVDQDAAAVEIIVANQAEKPMRLMGLQPLGLDAEGFAQKPVEVDDHGGGVPARAKKRVLVHFAADAPPVEKVRLWTKDFEIVAAAANDSRRAGFWVARGHLRRLVVS